MAKVVKRILDDLKVYKWSILCGGIYYHLVKMIYGAFCPMVLITGLPCAGCGMTRALRYVIQGEWLRAYHLQPSSFLFVAFAIYVFVMRYLLGRRVVGAKPMVIVLLSMLLIIYGYRMVNEFPSHAPMTYRYSNLLSNTIPWYRNALQNILEYVTMMRN